MAVITISKEFASGAVELAQELGRLLGCQVVGKAALVQLAQRLEMSPAEAELLARGQGAHWFRLVDEVLLHTVRRIEQRPEAALDDQRYFAAVKQLLDDLAQAGDVIILGWGGQYLLAEHPGAHHFRVVAPLAQRGQRLAARQRISLEQAQAECRRQDEISRAYVHHYLRRPWDDAHAYKLVLNLGALDFSLAKGCQILRAAM
ncbi:MAG: cytidylate kinase-like family protein [Desulfarculus sp.]|nr:MAG: cytidylate kinase-like family protein [Desulfarculus sp.]